MTELHEHGSSLDPGIAAADHRMMAAALLDQLSPAMRATLVLREIEGLEYEEIAVVMQVPVGRVKWRRHKARATFSGIVQKAQKEIEDV